jgi:membrane-anchored glycerophosphoryl diester phosphodiesterase (GDPDase)
MKGSTWLFTLASFVGGILVFSSGYNQVLRYLEQPTWTGLALIAFWLTLLLFFVVTLGFIMYAVDRKAGNVRVKIALFERLLGYSKEAVLPESREQNKENS